MRTLSKFAAAVAIGTAALVGSAQAATLINGASPKSITVGTETVKGTPFDYSFDYSGGLVKILLDDTTPDGGSTTYTLSGGSLVSPLIGILQDVVDGASKPFLSWSLAAGSYTLNISTDSESAKTYISAVPVPGAALLFATTALGFFGLNKRRKG